MKQIIRLKNQRIIRIRVWISWWMVHRVCDILATILSIYNSNSLYKLSNFIKMVRLTQNLINFKKGTKISGIDLSGLNWQQH